jgi:hypothetical protein
MRLANSVLEKVEDAKIEVFYADRGMTIYWNERRGTKELRYFTGWYWYIKRGNKAATAEHGSFRSRMAAYRDGFVQMQMRL